MISRLHKLYVQKVDKFFDYLKGKLTIPVEQSVLNVVDVLQDNVNALNPELFAEFNNSANCFLQVLCDEPKMENYSEKIKNITLTLTSSNNLYTTEYINAIKSVSVAVFFRSDKDSYIDEVKLLSDFKQRVNKYILAYNKLKGSDNSKDQLNYLRLTSFTDNLNDTVCSLLVLQTPDI